jgi:hypothetical protein
LVNNGRRGGGFVNSKPTWFDCRRVSATRRRRGGGWAGEGSLKFLESKCPRSRWSLSVNARGQRRGRLDVEARGDSRTLSARALWRKRGLIHFDGVPHIRFTLNIARYCMQVQISSSSNLKRERERERALLRTFHNGGFRISSGDEVGIEPYAFACVQTSHLVHLLHTHTSPTHTHKL